MAARVEGSEPEGAARGSGHVMYRSFEKAAFVDRRKVYSCGEIMWGCSEASEPDGWSSPLYRVVIPDQKVVVRINGLNLDAPEEDYLPAVRPYGLLRMAWALWRDVPDLEPGRALSLVVRVRREGRAEVLVATRFLAEHVRARLRARHRLVALLERLDEGGSSLPS